MLNAVVKEVSDFFHQGWHYRNLHFVFGFMELLEGKVDQGILVADVARILVRVTLVEHVDSWCRLVVDIKQVSQRLLFVAKLAENLLDQKMAISLTH